MKKVFASFLAACIFFSCSKDNSDSATTGETDFSVYHTDDPSPYDKVNIDIESVEVHFSDDSDSNAWNTIKMIRPGVYKLLKLSNGKDTLLATQKIAAK